MNPSESVYDQPEDYLEPLPSGDGIGIHIKSFGHEQREAAKVSKSALGPNLDFEGIANLGQHFVVITENDEEEAKHNQYQNLESFGHIESGKTSVFRSQVTTVRANGLKQLRSNNISVDTILH